MRAGNFVEETTTAIAGTAGNGNVTLTAIANTPRFSTVLGEQQTTVRYVIEDAAGGRFESGVGTVAANVLTRNRPQITWTGTIYSDNAPAPLAFGSSPAAGAIKVRISALAESAHSTLAGRVTLGDANGWGHYPASFFKNVSSNPGARVHYANIEYFTGYYLDTPGRLAGMMFNVHTASAGGSLRWALYDVGANGLPANRICALNTMSTGTTGAKIDSNSAAWTPAGGLWLTAGWYCIGYIMDVNCSLSGTGPGTSPSMYTRSNGYGVSDTVYRSVAYASGLATNPSPTGYTLADPGNGQNCGVWFGMKVTP